MKRGVGRGAGANGNGRAIYPPGTISTVTRYRQPEPPERSAFSLVRRIVLGTLVVVSALALAIAGGSYLYFHQSVAAVAAHTPSVVKASKSLDIPVAAPGRDRARDRLRPSRGRGEQPVALRHLDADPRRSADEDDLAALVPARPRRAGLLRRRTRGQSSVDRINSAYAYCGPKGTLLTVKHLTGLPINYLITVNFHGFKEIVDKIGGVWLDVDRRYYNKNTGAAHDNYANINLQPGYQLLYGRAGARFRPLPPHGFGPRAGRAPAEFVKAFKHQVAKTSRSPRCRRSSARSRTTSRSARAAGAQGSQVIQYALFAAGLPPRPLLPGQDRRTSTAVGTATCTASSTDRTTPSTSSRTRTSRRRRRRTRPRSATSRRRRHSPPSKATRDGAERQRRRRRGRERVVHARAARLPDLCRRRTSSSANAPTRATSTRRSTTTRRRRARGCGERAEVALRAGRRREAARAAPTLRALDPGRC